MLRSPGAGIRVALLAPVVALVLWAVLPTERLLAFLEEGGPVEASTAALYFIIAFALWFARRPGDDGCTWLALCVVFAAFGARELDLHKAWTGTSVLKVSFYLRDAPLHQKLTALPIVLAVGVSALYLVAKFAMPLWRALKQLDPVAVTMVCFFVTMFVSKVFDRSINILAEDFGMRFGEAVGSMVTSFEETLEFFLPILAILGLAQHRARDTS